MQLLKQWGIEGNYEGIGHLILGYAKGEAPAPKPRKENYVYYVKLAFLFSLSFS